MIQFTHSQRGSVLITTVIMTAIVAITSFGVVALSANHFRHQHDRTYREQAFRAAEAAMLEGIQLVADGDSANPTFKGNYTLGSNLNLPFATVEGTKAISMTIADDAAGVPDNYQITATAEVGTKTRTLTSLVRKNPSSQVFDYEYFLNNWGWWWGASITGNGDQRSNWDFDFRYNPTVNGHVFANGNVASNLTPVDPFSGTAPFNGTANGDPVSYVHAGSPRLTMPNLKSLTDYEADASGTIANNSGTVLNGVQGDTESQTGLYLEGTAANPIRINGKVVVRGDVVIKGVITGQGTLYVGGNLYVAGSVTYKNGPNFSQAPETMSATNRDAWVDGAMSKDLIAFAVRESILGGKVNDSSWKNNVFEPGTYGLKNVGNEAKLGADGISGTPDDNIKYLDTNGDGTADSTWNDADGDGAVDSAYNYDNQLKMSTARATTIQGYPVSNGTPVDFNTVASADLRSMQGIYYTNHVMGLYTANGPQNFDGTLICRDEAWIFTGALNLRYDSRIHSRYHKKNFGNDPNRIIDLGLPVAELVRILARSEVFPT